MLLDDCRQRACASTCSGGAYKSKLRRIPYTLHDDKRGVVVSVNSDDAAEATHAQPERANP